MTESIPPESTTDPPNTSVSRKLFHTDNRHVLAFGVFMLIGIAILAFIGRAPTSKMVGEPLPRLDLQPLAFTDQAVSRESLQGKIVLMHFWGTWCPPCRAEFPAFAAIHRQFADDPRLQVVSVSCSAGPEMDMVALKESTEKFLEEFDTRMPTWSDSAAMTRQQLAMLHPNGSFGYPTTILVDHQGTIVNALEGYLEGDMEELAGHIESLLAHVPADQ